MRDRKSRPGQDSRSCRDWVPSGCTGLPCIKQYTATGRKTQVSLKPNHGDFGGFFVRVFSEFHGNFTLIPVACPCELCKGGVAYE